MFMLCTSLLLISIPNTVVKIIVLSSFASRPTFSVFMFFHISTLLCLLLLTCAASGEENSRDFAMRPDAFEHFVEFVENASITARSTVKNKLDVPYGKSDRQKIDFFGTDLPDDSPIFLFIHGGYWLMSNKDDFDYIAIPMHKKGIQTMVIDFDLCPNVTVPDIIQEVRQAYLYAVKYAKKKGSRAIYVAGHSSGAHLAATLFMDSFFSDLEKDERDLLKQVFLISGVYDLMPRVTETRNEFVKLTNVTARESSPFWQPLDISNAQIEFYVIAGDHDTPSARAQAIKFNNKLQNLGWNSTYKLLEGYDHYNILEDYMKPGYELVTLIK